MAVPGRLLAFAAVLLLCSDARADFSPEQMDFFEKRIRPVLVERCYPCHSTEAEKLKAGLHLDFREGMRKGGESGKPAIIPGHAESSLLIEAIRYGNSDLQMPPQKAGGKLKEEQIADFVTWINQGAADPRTNAPAASSAKTDPYAKARQHWAFQPVTKPAVPVVHKPAWGQTPIDSFILAKLEAHKVQPAPVADRRTLIRRASYDLTGLPPTFEEVEAFVKDRSSDAFAKVVDRLLASPRYGERWGRYWLDVARFADTKGYVYGDREETKFVHSYAYRDWVIKALNDDLPYDRFLKLQIAADQMEDADRDALAAMGYLTLGRRFLGVVHDIIDDRIDVVMRGTQALTVGCARCHDHKFDPIPTKDYYSLYGVFNSCYERTVPLSADTVNARAFLEFDQELRKREEKFRTAFNAKREEQSKRLRAKTAEYLIAVLDVSKLPTEEFYSFVSADDLNPVVVRAWNTYLLSSSKTFHLVWAAWNEYAAIPSHEFSARAPGVINALKGSTNKLNAVVQALFATNAPASMREVAERYGKLLTDLDRRWTEAADKAAALSKEEEEVRQVLYAGDSPAQVPGGAIVDLEWYFDEPTRVELGRLQSQIDQWIIQSPGAPPHAVVLEDRSVQKNPRVFKRGNPATKGDEVHRQFLEILAGSERKAFQKGSGRLELAEAIANPKNPLTARVIVNRVWMHHFGSAFVRTPSDFGVRAEPPSHPELLDWLASYLVENGWSLKKLHRLIMLSSVYQQSSSGLPVKSGAVSPSQIDPENRLYWRQNRQRLDFEALRDSLLFAGRQLDLKSGGKSEDMFKAPFSRRRSVYGFVDRQFLPGALRVFDFANPDMHNPQRSETTVPQQALFFMNGPFVVEQSRAVAAQAQKPKAKVEEGVREMYRLLYQRDPTARQLEEAVAFIQNSRAESAEEAARKAASSWQYGYGEFDEASRGIKSFVALPHFTGESWQGGKAWPDEKLGWAQLTATGGHAGNDLQHAVIRRWTAPLNGFINIEGSIRHEHKEGDGIRAYVVSSRQGLLGRWVLHNDTAETKANNLEIKKGDTIDFVVSIHTSLNNNDFVWTPTIRMTGAGAVRDANGYAKEWNAKKEFAGPPPEDRKPLSPWEEYAQVLLLANEFVFVD